MMHVQCRLSKDDRQIDVAWIPEKHAEKDKTLRIKIDGNWEEGWKVEEVFSKLPSEYVEKHRDDHRYHRSNTDI